MDKQQIKKYFSDSQEFFSQSRNITSKKRQKETLFPAIIKKFRHLFMAIRKAFEKLFLKKSFYFSFTPLNVSAQSFSINFSLGTFIILCIMSILAAGKMLFIIKEYAGLTQKTYVLAQETQRKKAITANLEKTLEKYLVHNKIKELHLENMHHLLVNVPKPTKKGIGGNKKNEKDWLKEIEQEEKEQYEKKLAEQMSSELKNKKKLFEALQEQKKFLAKYKTSLKKFSRKLIQRKKNNAHLPFQWPVLNGLGEKINHNNDKKLIISAISGSEIVATAAGEVKKIETTLDGDKKITIEHPLGISTIYSHLDSSVKIGDKVEKNEVIGVTTNDHLTYQVMINHHSVKMNDFTFIKY